ncbi:gliding motility-associated peptidyl-prolyl isomerase GldI [Aureitalea sp. L0-47]|uniref:gliding motility-associated peptidyl-prolyl isomerase GldI n=1 Tax=Aureitalea sp. L0-47 TaxID=2816962 RepID=UPI002238C88E|nr:gliding motility-associated peptidyl-prolyl isomerase GldI [Aureitalea sp. L0-47]MCW5521016.1 gliding motility-associated peptidyl-prolyl isomerase GldI [Aureitalea sp. L0-47]
MNPRSLLIIATGIFALVSCKTPEARRPVQQSSGSFIKQSAERNKVLYKKEEERIATIMEANPEQEYLSSPSGFWYYYNIKDSLDIPTPEYGDIVTFTYDVRSLEGTSILTESETGLQIYKIDQSNQDLISGLRDGVKLMKVGEQVTFLFPSYKAYGYYGLQDKLGTNVPIQSTVTLKSIQQSQ